MEIKKFIIDSKGYFNELYITPDDLILLASGEELHERIDGHTLYVQMRK